MNEEMEERAEEVRIFEKAVNDCIKYVIRKAMKTEKESNVTGYAVIKATANFLLQNVLLEVERNGELF